MGLFVLRRVPIHFFFFKNYSFGVTCFIIRLICRKERERETETKTESDRQADSYIDRKTGAQKQMKEKSGLG